MKHIRGRLAVTRLLTLLVLLAPLVGLAPLSTVHAASVGTITAWGNNSSGQLDIPVGLNHATTIAAGMSHSLALRSDGTVLAWGGSAAGQTSVPAGLSTVTAIAAGAYHSLALKANGTVVAWGGSGPVSAGQASVPPGLSSVTAIAAGLAHSLALTADGTVDVWGSNSHGQRDIPAGLTNVVAIAAGSNHNLALKADGTVIAWGNHANGQIDIPSGLTRVVAIAAGSNHSLALKADGTVVAWGDNASGQRTVPSGLANVVAIAAGGNHSLALRADGTVAAWGDTAAQLGTIPSGLNDVTAIAAGGDFSLALRSDSTLVTGWGDNSDGELSIPAGLHNVKAISAGSFNSLALRADGTIAAWGDNSDGQLNFPSGLNNVSAISAAGYAHNYALKANGTIVGWGDGTFGELNIPSELTDAKAVAAGNYQGLALRSDGTVRAWGDNGAGELNVPSGLTNVRAIAMGGAHSVVLKADGTVATWGDSSGGQLNLPAGLTTVVAVSAGSLHSLALKADGTVVGWGNNRSGQLNIPDGLTNVIAITAGGEFSAALKADGTVVAWGTNYYDETNVPPGLSNVTAISGGAAYSLALYAADLTPPTTSATTTPASPNGTNGWFTSNVNVRLTVTDNPGGSGARYVYYSLSGAQTKPLAFVNAATTAFTLQNNGITTVTYYGVDNNGNIESAKTLSIKIDTLPPGVTATADRPPNAAGWHNAPVTYTYSGVDTNNGSGDVRCITPITYSGPDSSTASVTGTCTDAAGNVGSVVTGFKYDTTQPSMTASATQTDGTAYAAGTWSSQDVTVSFSCSDLTSGIAADACPAPVTVQTSGVTPSVSRTVSDRAGNSRSASFGPIWIDKAAPSASATPERAPDRNGWYTAPVSVGFSGVDPAGGSGGVSCQAPALYSGPDSTAASVTGTCTDAAGNVAPATASIKYDATKPTIAGSAKKADGTPYTAGSWTNQTVTVSFTCSDATSGIASDACPASQTFTSAGSHTANGAVSDQAGNPGSTSFGPILIDKTAPAVTLTPERVPDHDGWYTRAVSFSLSGVDPAGGSAGVTCDTAPQYSGPDSTGASVTGSCADAAGNVGTATATFRYDATKPTISITAPAAGPYLLNQVVRVAFSCNDALSGVASCVGTVANNGSLDTSVVGRQSFTVSATDAAGNSASAVVEYQVSYPWAGFFQPVDNLPTVNSVKAGSAVPIKFSLGGNQGLNIFAAGYPASQSKSCSTGAPVDEIEQTVTAGASSLQYDAGAGQYIYVWKTEKAWAGQCRQLTVRLADGTDHQAAFTFK